MTRAMLRPGAATGVGSWPGTDVAEALRTVIGELTPPHLPFLPELPGRGPWAGLLGRGGAFLKDLPLERDGSDWRFATRPGRDLDMSRSWLARDLDLFAELADGFVGPWKLQVTGPWTLASEVWVPRGERAVGDPGACRDLVASLAEGVADHLRTVRGLIPGIDPVLQIDEPALTTVTEGRVSTLSGMRRLAPVETAVVADGLRHLVREARGAGAGTVVVHSCAPRVPLAALTGSGVDAVNLDITLLGARDWEPVAELVESGIALWPGLVPTSGVLPGVRVLADALWRPWRGVGLPPADLDTLVVTPTCGLAGSTPRLARDTLSRAREVAAELADRSVS